MKSILNSQNISVKNVLEEIEDRETIDELMPKMVPETARALKGVINVLVIVNRSIPNAHQRHDEA